MTGARHRIVQVNFRASNKWLNIIKMLARVEGRSSSAVMRELLMLGLAQYVNIYYRTPQLIREQQLNALFGTRAKRGASVTQEKLASKDGV